MFTRTGYRQLLYKFPEYTLFLKCLLGSFTVLYIGTSFLPVAPFRDETCFIYLVFGPFFLQAFPSRTHT